MAAIVINLENKSEAYKEVEKLIYWTVHRFVKKYGLVIYNGDMEEYFAVANLQFVRVLDKYNEKSGSFTNYLQFSIWHRLLEDQREFFRRQNLSKIIALEPTEEDVRNPLENLPEPGSNFRLQEFVEELSEDARAVVMLALDTPAGLTRIMLGRGGSGAQRRAVLRHYLREMKWTAERVTETFNEIKEALGAY